MPTPIPGALSRKSINRYRLWCIRPRGCCRVEHSTHDHMQNRQIESNVVASLLSRRSRPSTYPSSLQSSERSGGRSVKTDLPPSGKRSSNPAKEADMIYISNKASRIRQREAQRARDNRAEIVKARSIGEITRR